MRIPFGRRLLATALLPVLAGLACADTPPASTDAAKLHALFARGVAVDVERVPGVRHRCRRQSVQRQADRSFGSRRWSDARRTSGISSGDFAKSTAAASPARTSCLTSYPWPARSRTWRCSVFRRERSSSAGEWLTYYEWMPVSQMSGVHIDIPALPRLAPLRNTKDYDDFLARLAVFRGRSTRCRTHEARNGRRLDAAGRADAQGPSADRAAVGKRRHAEPALQAL